MTSEANAGLPESDLVSGYLLSDLRFEVPEVEGLLELLLAYC